ncbi:MAG: ArsR/SmtB family transcription factor [Gammaproteobacteria bacterium]|jgi:DNA-binding transcriptional ArsR family regulator
MFKVKIAGVHLNNLTIDIDIFANMCKYTNMETTQTQEIADFLKALGEYNRLSLVYELCRCQEPQNAMCLCDCCSIDASVVSRHLKVLAEEGIVSFEKKGREKTYKLNRTEVANQLRALADKIECID